MFVNSIGARLRAIMAGGLMLGAATTAQASLIGDPEVTFTIEMTFDVSGVGSGFTRSDTETFGPIVNGPDHMFSIENSGEILFEIDIESESIFYKVTNISNFTATNIDGQLSFTGLDWVGQDGFIDDFNYITDINQVFTAGVIDNGHGIAFSFGQNSLAPNEMIETSITLEVVHVPEPGTLALFGLGLAGLGFARRRKAA